MKKIFVIGALVMMSGGALAENIINGNPFYHPTQGRFYNILTPIEFDTKFERFVARDEFGYGVLDNLAVMVSTSGSYDSSDNPQFGKWAWNDLQLGVDWVVMESGEYVSEVYGRGMQIYNTKNHLETVGYNWTAGARVGRITDKWSLAGVVQVDYLKDDVVHYDRDAWAMRVGMQGQYIIDSCWNFAGELMFDFDLFDDYYNGERLMLEVGLNYNLDETKYIGVYTSKDLVHSFDSAPMAFGVQFGVEF